VDLDYLEKAFEIKVPEKRTPIKIEKDFIQHTIDFEDLVENKIQEFFDKIKNILNFNKK
jgi:hypothetical protein